MVIGLQSPKRIERLYIRNRPKYEFVGYVCRKCKVVYLINYKSFKLKIRDMGLYEGFCVPRNPEIPKEEFLGLDSIYSSIKKKESEEQIIMTMKVKDIPKLKKLLQKHKIKISSSNLELTPLRSGGGFTIERD